MKEVLVLRPLIALAGIAAGALTCIAIPTPPAGAQTPTDAAPARAAVDHRIRVGHARLDVRPGERARVAGRLRPRTPGARVALEVSRDGRWRTLDRDRTGRSGRYRLKARPHATGSVPARVRLAAAPGIARDTRVVGRLNVFRAAYASWYGPGLYGNRTGCGGRLGYSQLGVAHKTLPCGTRVTFRHKGRTVRVAVIDRGPYVAGREFDLTAATARRLGFKGHGAILATR